MENREQRQRRMELERKKSYIRKELLAESGHKRMEGEKEGRIGRKDDEVRLLRKVSGTEEDRKGV